MSLGPVEFGLSRSVQKQSEAHGEPWASITPSVGAAISRRFGRAAGELVHQGKRAAGVRESSPSPPRSTTRWGEPRMSRQMKKVLSRGAAGRRPTKAIASYRRPGEEDTRKAGASTRARDRSSAPLHPRPVVVCAWRDAAPPDVREDVIRGAYHPAPSFCRKLGRSHRNCSDLAITGGLVSGSETAKCRSTASGFPDLNTRREWRVVVGARAGPYARSAGPSSASTSVPPALRKMSLRGAGP